MTPEEMHELADNLSRKAANKMFNHIPEDVEDIDIPSFQAGMRFCRAAAVEVLTVTAEALHKMGKKEAAIAMERSAESMKTLPIVGED